MTEAGDSTGILRALSIIGGIALMVAMTTDVISVIGRHTGLPLIGSIELVQASVVISASVGMVLATISRTHAIVHVLVDRLQPTGQRIAKRISSLSAALMFVAFSVGMAWSTHSHWGGYEQSEMLGIPYTPLRLILLSACIVITFVFTWQAWKGERK